MKQEHLPEQPKWLCTDCAVDWPCEPVRPMLLAAHLEGIAEVQRHLAWLIPKAATELGVADPAKLFQRFLGWTLTKDAACRVCGKAGHDFMPGIPPRLVPCDGYAVEPIHRTNNR